MSALQAAETLIEIGGQSFSNLQIQKLLYLGQMFHFGHHGVPLFDDDFEAWKLGPVIPAVYRRAKIYGSKPVIKLFSDQRLPAESTGRTMLEKLIRELPDKSPWKLVSITHWENGAWAKNYSQGDFGSEIPKADILNEYKSRVERAANKPAVA